MDNYTEDKNNEIKGTGKNIWYLKMHFTFAANTSLKEKAWEKHKYFRIPVGVPHNCSKLPTVWMQRKKKRNSDGQASCIYTISFLKFLLSVILQFQIFFSVTKFNFFIFFSNT